MNNYDYPWGADNSLAPWNEPLQRDYVCPKCGEYMEKDDYIDGYYCPDCGC